MILIWRNARPGNHHVGAHRGGETGHLVLASLHSRSAASSVERIVDAYPPERAQQVRSQLSESFVPSCPSAYSVAPTELATDPCSRDLLRGNHTVANLIREGKTAQIATVLQSGRKEGMLPLERCLADLVRAGQVTVSEATAAANSSAALATYLQA